MPLGALRVTVLDYGVEVLQEQASGSPSVVLGPVALDHVLQIAREKKEGQQFIIYQGKVRELKD